jgi:hypothetical protein
VLQKSSLGSPRRRRMGCRQRAMNMEWFPLGNEIPWEGWMQFAWKFPGCIGLAAVLVRVMNVYASDCIVLLGEVCL